MAFVLLYSIQDNKAATSTMEINVPDSFALANVIDFAADMALLINAVITGAIRRIGVGILITLPGGLRTTPDPDSDVEEGARFQFLTAGGFPTSFRIPTFDEDFIQAGTRAVDTADTAVATLVTAMISGAATTPGPITVTPSDKREEDIVALVSAQEQFMSSRG